MTPHKKKPLYRVIAYALHELAMARVTSLRPDLDLYWCNYLKRCSEQFPRHTVNKASVDTKDANPDLICISGEFNKRTPEGASKWVKYRIEVTANLMNKFNVMVVCDDKEILTLLHEMYDDGLRHKVQLN